MDVPTVPLTAPAASPATVPEALCHPHRLGAFTQAQTAQTAALPIAPSLPSPALRLPLGPARGSPAQRMVAAWTAAAPATASTVSNPYCTVAAVPVTAFAMTVLYTAYCRDLVLW